MKQIMLKQSQRRSLYASLFYFEKTLRMAKRYLSERDEKGILYTQKSSLDAQQRTLILEKIGQTLKALEEFVQEVGVHPTEEPLENIILAEMSISWEYLEESRSRRLAGYGEMDPEASKVIDLGLDGLSKAAVELIQMISPVKIDK